MLHLRACRVAPLLCVFSIAGVTACTPSGDPGDNHATALPAVADVPTEQRSSPREGRLDPAIAGDGDARSSDFRQADSPPRSVDVPPDLPMAVENDDTIINGHGERIGYAQGASDGFRGGGKRPTVRQARPSIQGALDENVLRRVVRAHINEIRYCYNKGLASDPNLKGRVDVRFTVGADGQVLGAEIAANTLGDPEVGTCMLSSVKRWVFPKPAGSVVVITSPFVLEPG